MKKDQYIPHDVSMRSNSDVFHMVESEGLKLDAAQLATLEKEFMDTFETFTVILSLSKK